MAFEIQRAAHYAESWKIQRRIIFALLMREILTRYGRHNIGFLWLFAEPMIFTLGVTAIWTAVGATHGSSLPITAFGITGYSSVLLWRNMPNRCIGAIEPNLALMYHRNVKIIDIFLSRLILEVAGASSSFVVLTLLFWSFGLLELPEDIIQVMTGWIMLAWFGIALAIFLASLAEESELVDKLWHPASYLLFAVSGAAFLVDAMPREAQGYLLLLPMVNGVEYIREGFFGSAITAHYDMEYMLIFNAVLSLFAFAELRKVSRKVVPE